MDQVRLIAICEGQAFEKTDPKDPNWDWNFETVNVDIFTQRPIAPNGIISYKEDWISFWWSELGYRPSYFRHLEKGLLTNPNQVPHIVIAFHEPNLIDIGDGWHRIAIAIKNDLKTIRAIVGRKRNLSE